MMEQVKAYRRSKADKEIIGTFVGRDGRDYLVKREDGSIMKARMIVPIVSQVAEKTEKPAPAPKKATTKKTEKPAKVKKTKIAVDAVGNRVGTMGAYINSLLIKGTTKAIAEACLSKKFGKNEAAARGKLANHIAYLGRKGFAVIEFKGTLMLVNKETKLKIDELTQQAVAAVYESMCDVIANSIPKED